MHTRPLSLFASAALVSLVAGCTNQTLTLGGPCVVLNSDGSKVVSSSNSNGDPCGNQLYYPTGVTVDPLEPNTIYVSNGNADLRYSAGTVTSVDTAKFECAMAYFCRGVNLNNKSCSVTGGHGDMGTLPADCMPYAADLSKLTFGSFIDPSVRPKKDGDNGRPDCRNDPTDQLIVECDEPTFISSAVQVGNFAGSIRVQTGDNLGGFPGVNRRLWLPVRGDPSITFVYGTVKQPTVMATGSAVLGCQDGDHVFNGDRDPNSTPPMPSCSDQRITVRDFPNDSFPGFECSSSDTSKCVSLPPEPFGIYYDEGCRAADLVNGVCSTTAKPYQHLVVTYLQSGEVALIDASGANPVSTVDSARKSDPVVKDLRGGFFPADAAGRRGTYSIAPKEPGNERSWWYATSRLNPILATFRIADADVILGGQQLILNTGAYASGDDVRDIVFDPADCGGGQRGCRAFAVNNHPPSVFTVDTRYDDTPNVAPGSLRNQVTDIVNVCQGPSRLAFRRLPLETPAGTIEQARLYVVCYSSGQVLVIDPDLSTLVGQTIVGRGSNEITFNFGFDEVRQQEMPPARSIDGKSHYRAYVTDFLDMNVAVIDLDPGSPTENHVIGRIGLSDPPRLQ